MPVRFTSTGQAVYAIVLGQAPGREVEVDVRLAPGGRVMLEGQRVELAWTPSLGGTRIALPEPLDRGPATTLRFEPATAVEPLGDGGSVSGSA